jgi:hypothetical protein
MDPVTAAFTALDSFNKVLLTPPGQLLMTDAQQLVIDLFGLFNVHLAANAPASAVKAS